MLWGEVGRGVKKEGYLSTRGLAQLSGTGSRRVPVPAKGENYCSSGFEIRLHGIGDLQSPKTTPGESCGSGDPSLTPDGLQIRQSKGPIEMEKPGGDRHPLTGRASPQMTPKTPRPMPEGRINQELLAPRRGERLGEGETKESLQLTI